MAPIENQSSYSVKSTTTSSSSSTKKPFYCLCKGSLNDGFEWFLPIARRGNFFQDSFFENSRSHFDDAVRDVLSRWGETGMLKDTCQVSGTDNLILYRRVRSRDPKEENQAVTVTFDKQSHKIVLDVHDFMDGEVKVKVIGDKEVRVEGLSGVKKEGERSIFSQKFSRRFILTEDADVDAISSVMSSDGVLTITVPQKSNVAVTEGKKILEYNGSSSTNTSKISNRIDESAKESSCTEVRNVILKENNASQKFCECCYKKLQSGKKASEASEHQEGLKIPINSDHLLKTDEKSESKELETTSQSNIVTEDSKLPIQKIYVSTSSNEQLSNQSETNTEQKVDKATSTADIPQNEDDKEVSGATPIYVNLNPLPITRRGLFFTDSIFENSRNDFQSAVQDILTKWGERSSSLMDDLSCYRNIRTRDLREENQAVTVSEDENNHKFVLDVHDFMNGGEVNVKAINDRELVVEGQVEKQQGGSKSFKRFFKRFVVPGDVILGSVTSIMSSDGVLTITAPKKPPTIQIRDVTSPVRSNEIQQTSSHSKQESVCEAQNTTHSTEATSNSTTKIPCQSDSSNINQSSSSYNNSMTNEYIIPVQVDGRISISTADHNVQNLKVSNESETTEDKTMKLNSDSSIKKETSTKTETSNTDDRRNIEITRNNVKSSEENIQTSTAGQRGHRVESISSSSMGRLLPVTRRGSFFSDSFFEDSRQSFQKAVSEVLEKFNENSATNDIETYRSLRQRNLTKENQAVNVQEDEHCHKVVLDARDFTEGKINVSIVGERELLIEGRTESKNDSSSISQSFSRRFLLPESVDIDSITSAISSDGVLTVESSKKGSSGLLSNVQKTSNESHSRNENHSDSGHKWEEKSVKESSEQSEGYSSHSYSTSYRAHQEQSFTQDF